MPPAAQPLARWVALARGLAACAAGWICAGAAGAERTLVVGLERGLKPISFLDRDGDPAGFAVDLMNAAAREAHFAVKYVPAERSDLFRDFYAGRTDALANVLYSPDRNPRMWFSVRTLELKPAIFCRRGDRRITSLESLRGLRVAGLGDNAGYFYLRAHGLIGPNFLATSTQRGALEAIEDGRADAALGALIIGLHNLATRHLTDVVASPVPVPGLDFQFHFAAHPGDAADLARLNQGLAAVYESGEYDRIYARWIGAITPRHWDLRAALPYAAAAAVALAAALAALFVQRRILRRLGRQAQALSESEERLQRVLDGSNDGFWDWNLQENRVLRSERWARMLEYEPDEIPPTIEAGRALVHPNDLAAYDAAQQILESGGQDRYSMEYRMRAKSGAWRWVRDRGKVVRRGPGGQPTRMAGTHTDITAEKAAAEEREQLRLKMLQTQKLESLGILAGGIAHDFNNLLTGILVNAQLARTNPEAAPGCLDIVEAAGRRAADLCRQMLGYAGRGRLEVQPVDLPELVRDTARLLAASISKKAELKLELPSDLPAVEADVSQLRQVVMNLVINASEALGEGCGTIVVRAGRGRPDPAPGEVFHGFELAEGECVRLEVADSGCGMDAATLAHIFDPFFTTKSMGRGLGLAAVLGIMRSHQGALAVRSSPGAGTCFRLYFHASDKPPAVRCGDEEPAAAAPTERGFVLVADDEPTVLAAASSLLRRRGYGTVEALDGEQAVRAFRSEPKRFAAILLDLTMPRLDGAEALRAIRAIDPNAPVLVMSGYGNEDVLARLRGQRRVPVLSKPFTESGFFSSLAEVIRA